MDTIVLNIEDNANSKRIAKAIELIRGVKKVRVLSDEQKEDLSILKACKAAKKTERVSKQDVLKHL